MGGITLDFGHRRLIARNEFRNTTNAFNGVHVNLAQEELWRMRAFLVKPIADTFGVSNRSKIPSFGACSMKNGGTHGSTLICTISASTAKRRGSKTGRSAPMGSGPSGLRRRLEWITKSESVFQKGTRGGLDHFAHFQHGEVGYTFDALWLPRVVVQYDYASGTANPNGQTSHTFDTLFGARRFEYTPTGISARSSGPISARLG